MPDSRPNFPKQEEEILAFWDKEKIFEKTLEKEAPRGPFVFFEGPPTANGKPGIHHVEARAFKDCIPRFRTMQGYHVDRKAGWDTHGLPVELEVEKQLGFTGKKDIEAFGIAEFNKRCKESVWKYLADWQQITRRIGFWLDLEHPYVTYEPAYVESLWWVIKQIWDKGLLYQDYRVTPHCPRCGTSLSSHELAQGYKDVEDPAVFVKFRVTRRADGTMPNPEEPEFLVAWTTTPWTLPANVALAVGEKIRYGKVRYENEFLWIAKDRMTAVGLGAAEIVEEKFGEELVGTAYEPLYPFLNNVILSEVPLVFGGTGRSEESLSDSEEDPSVVQRNRLPQDDNKKKTQAWSVVPADFVSTTDGSGIVHTAVMYGADDFDLGTKLGLPKHHLVGLDGKFLSEAGPFAGMFVKDADPKVMEDLETRRLLLKKETITHTYPFCWRCKSPIIYYAKDSWYIRMSGLRDELLKANESIHWEPDYIKDGRFGEWLREVKDWAFSRERYWGTPLPIWICEACGEKSCVGSFKELRERATHGVEESFDPHRPFVDEVSLKCDKCSGSMRRVSEVCDVWFDSGAMPFAQWHYPFENKERIEGDSPLPEGGSRGVGEAPSFPADYISEAIDQTRGWFYTLLAVSVLLGKEAPYKNVICLGHVLDAKGKKMSKSIGNVINPVEVIDQYGADAVRWYMYTVNQPGDPKRFDLKALDEMVKKVFLILWNVLSFYELYAQNQGKTEISVPSIHILDRWVLTRLHTLVRDATADLESYKVTEPARAIGEFVSDLSTWYVRRSRDRFKGQDKADKTAALATLRTCLLTLSKLLAPFTPFLAEALYQRLSGGKRSVHLEDWPQADVSMMDETILRDMGQGRSVISRLLEKRAAAGIPVRQALARAIVVVPEGTLGEEFIGLIKDEVNVKAVAVKKGEYEVDLDLHLTPELLREGMVREMVRQVNDLRKKAGLTIQDRIELYVESPDAEVNLAAEEHRDVLLSGTLSSTLRTTGDRPQTSHTFRTNEADVTVGF